MKNDYYKKAFPFQALDTFDFRSFCIDYGARGSGGSLIFGSIGSGRFPNICFYQPPKARTTLIQLPLSQNMQSGLEAHFCMAVGKAAGAEIGAYFSLGRAYAKMSYEDIVSDWKLLPQKTLTELENKFDAEKLSLNAPTASREARFAVEMPKAIGGIEGYFVLTQNRYFPKELCAVAVPYEKNEEPKTFNTKVYKDSCDEVYVYFGKTNQFYARGVIRGVHITIDGETARELSRKETGALIENYRVPGVFDVPPQVRPLLTALSAPSPA